MVKPTLNENWEAAGTDYDEFKQLIADLTDCTTLTQYAPEEINLLSLVAERDDYFIFKLQYYGVDCDSNEVVVVSKKINLHKSKLKDKAVPSYIIDELRNNRLMVWLGKKVTAFTSPNFIGTLITKLRMDGPSFLEDISPERDAHIAKVLNNRNAINVVSRKIDDCTKVFAAFSEQYPYIPQTILLDVKDKLSQRKDLGEAVCSGWHISHSTSTLYLEFPDVADDISKVYNLPDVIVPGVILKTSDVGDCSVTCTGTWNIKGSRIVQNDGYKRKHRGEVTVSEILKGCDEKVFKRYRKLPGRLAELLTIDIVDPAEAIEFAIKKINIASVGKKCANAIQKGLVAEINPGLQYTAYDIVCNIMSVPSRLSGVKDDVLKKVEEKIIDVAFLKWETFEKTQNQNVVLTA